MGGSQFKLLGGCTDGTCWKSSLQVVKESCSSGVVLPKSLYCDTTPEGVSGEVAGVAGHQAREKPGAGEAGLKRRDGTRKENCPTTPSSALH